MKEEPVPIEKQIRERTRNQGSLIARNSVINFVGAALPMVLGVVTIPSIIRGLGTDRFGVLSMVWMVLGYFGFIDLGLGRAATKFVAEALGRGEEKKVPQIVWTAVAIQAALGLIGTFLLMAITPPLVNRFFNIPPHLIGETKKAFYLLALSIPVSLVSVSLRGVLEAAQRFDLVNLVKAPSSMATFLLPLIGVMTGLSLPGIVTLLFMARAASMIVFLFLCFEVSPNLRSAFTIQKGIVGPLFVYGGWVTVSNVVGPFLSYMERFLIAHLLSIGALTFYAAPYEMISRVAIFPASIAAALFPAFSYQGTNDPIALREMFSRPLKYLLFIVTLTSAILFVFAKQILGAWLGDEFARSSTTVFQVLVACFFLNSLAHVPVTAIQGLGRPDLKGKLDLIELPVYFALCWWLIPQVGLAGAALAKLGITIIDMFSLFWLVNRVFISSSQMLSSVRLDKAVVVSGTFTFAILLLELVSKPSTLHIAMLFVFVSGYIFLFLKAAMDERDWSAMRGVWKHFGGRLLV